MEALLKEIVLQKNYLNGETIETIYFGGGTPSLMPDSFLGRMLETIKSTFQLSPTPEVTLEANPDDFTTERVQNWKNIGINRLSIGIQSFFEEDLTWMNRAHNSEMAKNAISLAQAAGITNISVDLIYGGPTLTDEHWRENLRYVFESGVPHISAYALTVEPSTALDTLIRKGRKEPVDAEKQARHFEMLVSSAKAAGFEHYEISNLARPGWHSRHNSSYWQGVPYLGIGPSAHSFNGVGRRWNISNNALYIQAISKNTVPFEEEILTLENRINEYIMTSLRTIQGISFERLENLAGPESRAIIENKSSTYINEGYVELTDTHIRLTNKGRFLADGIAAEFFW